MATGFPIIFATRLWTPELISTSLWLDASDATTIILNGSLVSQWNDKSGNQRNVVQPAAALQPIYNSVGFNALPTISSPGNRHLSATMSISELTNKISIFCATTMNSATADSGRLLSYQATGDANDFSSATSFLLARQGTTSNFWLYRNSSSIATSSIVYAQPSVVGFAYTGTNGSLFINGSEIIGAASSGNFGNSGSFNIFSNVPRTNFWNGLLSEVVMITSVLSTTVRQKLEGYLAWKWGTVSSLPSTHPYKNSPPYAS